MISILNRELVIFKKIFFLKFSSTPLAKNFAMLVFERPIPEFFFDYHIKTRNEIGKWCNAKTLVRELDTNQVEIKNKLF